MSRGVRGWTLAGRIGALLAVAVLVLLGALTALVVITTQIREATNETVDRIAPSRRVAGDLLTTLVEQQNALRGYALRGEEISLRGYRGALGQQERIVAELMVLLPDDLALRAELDAILAAARAWQDDAAEPIVAAVAAFGPRPPDDALYQTEQQRFAPLQSAAEKFRADLQTARDQAARRLDDLGALAVAVVLASAATLIALFVVTALLLRRWVTRPLAALARDARQVADGDYGRQVGADSWERAPAEIATLAADVDAMRGRIVADRDELAAQAHELERSNRDLEQFAYVASHDLQEPLRKVSSFCQLLQRRYGGQLDERADQYIEFAVDGAQRMQELINDLLAFSRVGRSTDALVPVELAGAAQDAISQLQELRESVDGQVAVGELPMVRGDRTLLTQLLANLVGNGLKFHRDGVPARVEINSAPSAEGWDISVSDNGVGIAPEYADKVFVIFQRLHDRDAYPGTGIGLALAKRIVEFHGGRIWLDTAEAASGRSDSDPRVGTTIRFTLPKESSNDRAADQSDQGAADRG